jgi:uncharacterized membrane protein YphA (DoxX/SURF4 family)
MNPHLKDWAPVPIRAVVGGGLAYHGAPKIFTSSGHQNIVSMLREMDVPQPDLMGWVVGALELFGGLALLAGVRVRGVSASILGEVVVNVLNGVRRGAFPQPLPGQQPLPAYEASFFYGCCSVALMLAGAGKLSVDGRLRGKE